jgi:Domain of unknown function (DUF4383)
MATLNTTSTLAAGLRSWTPAQVAALVLGAFWVLNGIAVFALGDPGISRMGGSGEVDTAVGYSISANGWHGMLHLVTGIAGLASCASLRAARAYCLVVGVLYLALALWSLLFGVTTIAGVVYVDAVGSLEHLVEAFVLLGATVASRGGRPRLA